MVDHLFVQSEQLGHPQLQEHLPSLYRIGYK